MAWLRYLAYFLLISLVTWGLTALEVTYPGSLKLQVFTGPDDTLGTSEFSPIEMIQPLVLAICGMLMAWVARFSPLQRPLALPFGALAAIFIVREWDYFLDRLIADNFWQVVAAIIAALSITYLVRQRRRLQFALARVWPSPGLVLIFAGAVILFSFVRFVGHEPLWQSIMGDDYQRVVMLGLEEFIELIGYLFWLIGAVEYAWQVRVIAQREPETAAVRRRRHRLRRQN
jgi:drug/metabolite transporter (DMT)-like permease